MHERLFEGILLTFLLASALFTALGIQQVTASDEPSLIYIRADGSIEPSTVPIQQDGNLYTLTGDITDYDGIVVERNNIILDGANHLIDGGERFGGVSGVMLEGRENVTVKNMRITLFWDCISLHSSSKNFILANNMDANHRYGVGLVLDSSSNNLISGNNITDSYYYGIYLYSSSNNNSIIGNNIQRNNNYDFGFFTSRNNSIYHNNFDTNQQVDSDSTNFWDNGCEGNYWDDYNGTDSDGEGIGDTPYVIDSNNTDHYPLMNRYWIPADVNHDLKVDIFDVVKITGAYGSTPASPNWNPHADITQPFGKIDIFDVVLYTSHYEETYP